MMLCLRGAEICSLLMIMPSSGLSKNKVAACCLNMVASLLGSGNLYLLSLCLQRAIQKTCLLLLDYAIQIVLFCDSMVYLCSGRQSLPAGSRPRRCPGSPLRLHQRVLHMHSRWATYSFPRGIPKSLEAPYWEANDITAGNFEVRRLELALCRIVQQALEPVNFVKFCSTRLARSLRLGRAADLLSPRSQLEIHLRPRPPRRGKAQGGRQGRASTQMVGGHCHASAARSSQNLWKPQLPGSASARQWTEAVQLPAVCCKVGHATVDFKLVYDQPEQRKFNCIQTLQALQG